MLLRGIFPDQILIDPIIGYFVGVDRDAGYTVCQHGDAVFWVVDDSDDMEIVMDIEMSDHIRVRISDGDAEDTLIGIGFCYTVGFVEFDDFDDGVAKCCRCWLRYYCRLGAVIF